MSRALTVLESDVLAYMAGELLRDPTLTSTQLAVSAATRFDLWVAGAIPAWLSPVAREAIELTPNYQKRGI